MTWTRQREGPLDEPKYVPTHGTAAAWTETLATAAPCLAQVRQFDRDDHIWIEVGLTKTPQEQLQWRARLVGDAVKCGETQSLAYRRRGAKTTTVQIFGNGLNTCTANA